MVNPLVVVDSYILVKVESGAHWVQRTAGIPPIVQSRFTFACFSVLCVCNHVRGFRLIDIALVAVLSFQLVVQYPWMRSHLERFALMGFKNPLKLNTGIRFQRIILVIAFLLPPYRYNLEIGLLALSLYLLVCDQLPPGVSRLRRLYDGLVRRGAPTLADLPV